jgi:hypothetical protein
MKAIAVALVLLGFIAGCARTPSSSPSASPTERPDLAYKTKAECEKAGRTWSTGGVCV